METTGTRRDPTPSLIVDASHELPREQLDAPPNASRKILHAHRITLQTLSVTDRSSTLDAPCSQFPALVPPYGHLYLPPSFERWNETRRSPAPWSLMLINLLPDFLAVLQSSDRVAAYHQYFDAHKALLSAYWDNYVVDPSGPHFEEVVRATALASRDDLRVLLERTDIEALARATANQCAQLLESDIDVDVLLMVGVGAANAGELVVNGRGVAFVCLEHFTSVANPETQGLGLDPELIPLWLAHEIAHTVRYTSPTSRSELRQLVSEQSGYYSYWETGRRASLRELLMNEGIAVQVSRAISPGHAAWEYFGYGRRQYARVRELEPLMIRTVTDSLDRSGLGLRLRYLSGGMSDDARTVDRYVLPERGGYFLGARMVEPAIAARGLAWTVRASAAEIAALGAAAAASA